VSNRLKNGLKNSKMRISKLIKTLLSSFESTKKPKMSMTALSKSITLFSIIASLLMNSTFIWMKETKWWSTNHKRKKSKI